MFTGFQLEIVAYKAPGSYQIYCPLCWRTPGDTDEDERLERDAAIVRYDDAEEYADGEGLYCDECGAMIVEPDAESGLDGALLQGGQSDDDFGTPVSN